MSEMNPVIRTIKEHIVNQDVRFVFPSQTAASLWARKTCTLGIARSVAAKRFLAWDHFKGEIIQEGEPERSPANQVMRKLFAEALVRKNAEAAGAASGVSENPGGFPFKSIIPPEHTEEGGIFAPYIGRLLPSLALWEKLTKKAGSTSAALDDEDRDYEIVKNEYSSFLERFNLFEPSWEEIKIRAGKTSYVLFFPELIEDFQEYGALLLPPRFIIINAEVDHLPQCLVYQSAREEIRCAVVEMERLHEEEGLPYEEMALSVPELEKMEPCLVRELSLRHIPFIRRAGKKLGETGSGRLFTLISECAASQFSFNSLKALILNDHIPWKDRDINKKLIRFGIKYNCVSAYIQDGKTIDIWEEAFREAYNDGGKDLRPYYRTLKTRVLALGESKKFADIRKYYFAFRHSFLDMETISGENDAVLSRCIEELSSLIELEEKLNEPSMVPASAFAFFLSCLGDREYVRANQKPGVNIFKWRVAAASPFCCHFVLNASQSAAPVLYQPMKFLRQDKRKHLGLEDRDATGAFFSLCDTGEDEGFKCRARVSASYQTFSGWAIPHSFFGSCVSTKSSAPSGRETPYGAASCIEDPYRDERSFWGKNSKELKKIYPLQKHSYEMWKLALVHKKNYFSFFTSTVPAASTASELLSRAVSDGDGRITVSPTGDLNVYYECAIKWLCKRVFGAEEFSLEAALLDDISLGLLYHKILEKLFARIKDEDLTFVSGRLDVYKRWVLEITKDAIREHPAFKGPLAVPLVSPQAFGMAKKVARLLELEAERFNGYRVAELEHRVSYKTEELLITGVIDRVSISPDGEPVIMDYKTTNLPEQTPADELSETPLSEFQMPLYVKLYEKEKSSRVQGACFYSINGKRIKPVMGDNMGGRTKAPSREEYAPFLEAAEKQIKEFGQKVSALNFIPLEIQLAKCSGCPYKPVCRSAYFLNPALNPGRPQRRAECP